MAALYVFLVLALALALALFVHPDFKLDSRRRLKHPFDHFIHLRK
jgi:hypothetical protein